MKKHLLRIGDLTKSEMIAILDRAHELNNGASPRRAADLVLGLLFFQRSTRTRFGFHAAVGRMGGSAVTLEETKHQTGMALPESLEDTLRSIAAYCDAFVLRHPSNGAIDQAASILSAVPLVNGGNGTDEHPSQALIDLFSIREWHNELEGLRIGIVGDLAHSRAAHSLILALRSFPPRELRLIHPASASAPENILASFVECPIRSETDLDLRDLDVLYVAGLPEGTNGRHHSRDVRLSLRITPDCIKDLSGRCLILSPLPRIDEIDPLVDHAPNAYYFTQSAAGIWIRTAILEACLFG